MLGVNGVPTSNLLMEGNPWQFANQEPGNFSIPSLQSQWVFRHPTGRQSGSPVPFSSSPTGRLALNNKHPSYPSAVDVFPNIYRLINPQWLPNERAPAIRPRRRGAS